MSSVRRYVLPSLFILALACGDEPPTSATSAPALAKESEKHNQVTGPTNVLYLTNNDPTPGLNAVLAFRRNADCSVTVLGRFPMGGTGVGNPNFRLGTLDSDQSLVVSPDRNLLFAVNAGSDAIAVFSIRPDGSLQPVNGSPIPSGGQQPASLGVRDRNLYVAHKTEDPGETSSEPPNYTVFRLSRHGRLKSASGSTMRLPVGSSPTQMLVSNDGKFVFSTDLLVDFPRNFYPTDGFPAAPGAGGGGTLRSFVIDHNRLKANRTVRIPGPDKNFPDPLGLLSGSQHISGTTNGALGLQDHPSSRILYVGFPFRFQIGVYTWDPVTGELTFRNVVSNSGQMISWIQVSEDGRFMYTVNRLDSSVSVYDLSNPLTPVEIIFRDLLLAPGATQGGLGGQQFLTSDGRCLYILEQRISDAAGDGSTNALHTFQTFGGFKELAPVNLATLGVTRTARPQGIAAY